MKFAEFQSFRDNILHGRADVLDCAATNLYSALAALIPPVSTRTTDTVHRCHLATDWVNRFAFPPETSRRALISCGVRDSLALLFRHHGRGNALLCLPADNYPVYAELARAAELRIQAFPTLPEPTWPDSGSVAETELLLVTNPLKPLGRYLTESDVATLTEWLAIHPGRRLLLDAVYTFEEQFSWTTLQLLATGQTILLHSLTKGWLHPRLFGIALVPENDVEALAPLFRANPPPQSNLAHTRELMANHADLPRIISRELDAARTCLLSAIPAGVGLLADTDAPGYFMPIRGRWQDVLANANVLGLPASVFGSSREDITILSSLSFLK